MERHEIEAFLTLAEELHFGRTAERLSVSTARVSQTIKKLERRVGVPLFERTSRRVLLTPVGRRFHDDLSPAYERVNAALEKAITAGRGITGTLRVGFVGAAAGQLLLRVTDLFGGRHPGCQVTIKEVQMADALPHLHAGEIDMLIACVPLADPAVSTGPVLLSEPRMLAVAASHPFARRPSLSIEDLARDKVLQAPCSLPDPGRTPGGRPIEPGRSADTLQEVLTLVGAGQGVFPVGAHATRFYARPDVVYVPFHDAPPLDWAPVWLTVGATARVRAFAQAAGDTVQPQGA